MCFQTIPTLIWELLKSLLTLRVRQTWTMFSKLKALVDSEKILGIIFKESKKTICRNSEFSLPSMIPLVTEKLRVSVLCIWPKPITRSPDSPHREFRNFLVFLEFGVIATCALADSLTSET